MILADIWRKKIEAMNERDRTRTMKGSLSTTASFIGVSNAKRGEKKRAREKNTYTRSPGESSVYNLSIVLDEPPAPAARDELGLETCDATARRLAKKKKC